VATFANMFIKKAKDVRWAIDKRFAIEAKAVAVFFKLSK
jgi:hypothetical protein